MNDDLILKKFISQFDIGIDLNNLKIISIGKNYYYAEEYLSEISMRIKRDVFGLGLFLGSKEGKIFRPSPAFIDILSKMQGSEKKKIFVNEQGERLFLYGKNILMESIIVNNNLDKGYVFVQNKNDENLGYGVFQQQGKDLIVKNLLDKGYYLRKEVKKKKL
ncbi:MAG: hypothetical protein QXK76_00970 [Candidatus Woesearchaeota archaeon]